MRAMVAGKLADTFEDLRKAFGHRDVGRRRDDAVGDMGEAHAGLLDDPPAGMTEAGVDAEDANRNAHALHPSSAKG